MYKPGTILVLKDPQSKPDEPFPYDRVRVIGPSPISYSASSSWDGVGAQGVVISPVEHFDATIDEPYGKLLEVYTIESEPEAQPIIQGQVIHVEEGPTPEDVFQAATSKSGVKPKPPRPRAKANG